MAEAKLTETVRRRASVGVDQWAGYGQAIIHITWLSDDTVRRLLFGMVELKPSEMPLVASSAEQQSQLGGKSQLQLLYRRYAVDVVDAVSWYEGAMLGRLRLPEASDDATPGDDVPLLGGPFACEPAWPHLEASNKLDFAPDWAQQSRAHFLHAKECLPASVLELLGRDKNRSILEQWLLFDLVDLYNDYLGAICLVAPNPLFRSIEKSHLDQPNDGAAETVAYKLIARAGQCLDGTRLEIVNERLRGRMAPVSAEFDSAAVRVLDFPDLVHNEGRTVTHPRYGLLQWNDPAPLIRAARLGLSIESRRKNVVVPPMGRKRPSYSYRVSEWQDAEVSVVGTRLDATDVEARNIAAEQRRARSQRRPDQLWFHDAREEAALFIRERIGEAQKSVLIADPYFTGHAMLALGHAIRWPTVHLRVLTSKRGLKSEPENATIKDAMATFQSYPTQPEIRVLPGKTPALHDRFLVVDEDVWFSGNSLSTLGERAGMIFRLPVPEAVVGYLEDLWNSASPLPSPTQQSNSVVDKA